MNKEQLVDAIAKTTGFTKKDTEIFLNAYINAVQESLRAGNKVGIVGFGAFEVRHRAARKGRNPKTQEVINIPATKAPTFKAGKIFKDTVNGKKGAAKKAIVKKPTKPAPKKKKS